MVPNVSHLVAPQTTLSGPILPAIAPTSVLQKTAVVHVQPFQISQPPVEQEPGFAAIMASHDTVDAKQGVDPQFDRTRTIAKPEDHADPPDQDTSNAAGDTIEDIVEHVSVPRETLAEPPVALPPEVDVKEDGKTVETQGVAPPAKTRLPQLPSQEKANSTEKSVVDPAVTPRPEAPQSHVLTQSAAAHSQAPVIQGDHPEFDADGKGLPAAASNEPSKPSPVVGPIQPLNANTSAPEQPVAPIPMNDSVRSAKRIENTFDGMVTNPVRSATVVPYSTAVYLQTMTPQGAAPFDLLQFESSLTPHEKAVEEGDLVTIGPTAGPSNSPAVISAASIRPHGPQVAVQIAQAVVQSKGDTLEISLNPAELGRIRISMVSTEQGTAVTILAERPETADLMRRNIDSLAQEFQQLGHDNLSFSFGQDTNQDDQNPQSATHFIGSDVRANDVEHKNTPQAVYRGGLDLKL